MYYVSIGGLVVNGIGFRLNSKTNIVDSGRFTSSVAAKKLSCEFCMVYLDCHWRVMIFRWIYIYIYIGMQFDLVNRRLQFPTELDSWPYHIVVVFTTSTLSTHDMLLYTPTGNIKLNQFGRSDSGSGRGTDIKWRRQPLHGRSVCMRSRARVWTSAKRPIRFPSAMGISLPLTTSMQLRARGGSGNGYIISGVSLCIQLVDTTVTRHRQLIRW